MMILVRNEVKKLLSRRKTLVVLIAFAALVALLCYANYYSARSYNRYNSPEAQKQNIEAQIKADKEMEADSKIPEDQKQGMEQQLQALEQQLNDIEAQISSNSSDWKTGLKNNIESLKQSLNDADTNNQGTDKEQIRKQLITYEYLVNHDIQPTNPGKVTASDYLTGLLTTLGAIFLIIGIVVFSADMVSGEFTPPTMKVLLTQPVTRAKILLSKFIAVVVSSIALILGVEIIAYLVMGIIFGFGNSMYPVVVGTKYTIVSNMYTGFTKVVMGIYGSSYIIPMWQYLIYILLFEVLFIIAATSFAFFLSTVFKSSMVSVATGTVLSIAIVIFQNIPVFRRFQPYLLTTYGNFTGVIDSTIANLTNTTNVTPLFASLVLIAWTAVCYIISHIIFVKRDVLI